MGGGGGKGETGSQKVRWIVGMERKERKDENKKG